MKTQHVRVEATSSASPPAVYALLKDSRTWPAWSELDESEPEGLAPGAEEVVGTVRVNRRGKTRGWDEVTELVPDQKLSYDHLKGLPVKGYHASVTLTPSGTGTSIVWEASFAPKVPLTGGLLQRGITDFLGGCVRGLAEHAADRRA